MPFQLVLIWNPQGQANSCELIIFSIANKVHWMPFIIQDRSLLHLIYYLAFQCEIRITQHPADCFAMLVKSVKI